MNRTKIEDTLMKIGIPAGIKGFAYIADAVEYIDAHGEFIGITKNSIHILPRKETQRRQGLKEQSDTHLKL